MIRLLSFALAASVLGNLGQLWHTQVQAGQAQIEATALEQAATDAALAQRTAQLQNLAELKRRHEALQAETRDTVATLHARLQQRQRAYQRLEDENQSLRAWGDARLPAELARLRQRPAFAQAGAYRDWLSDPERLPATGQPAANESGSVAGS
nr:LysB family phage lysis regulatory protein [Chitinimonas arctica]